jgi:glutamyl-tRNA synthetase
MAEINPQGYRDNPSGQPGPTDAPRVRFAPSPTGPLHIGGVRTALYNYLFARKYRGTFILRIEDTDRQRYVPGTEEYIIESLRWCGMDIDEGVSAGGPYAPYRQSERSGIYQSYAMKLVESGHAYLAFDSPEELDELRREKELQGEVFQYDHTVRDSLKNSLSLPSGEVDRLVSENIPRVVRFKMPAGREVAVDDIIRGEVRVDASTLDDKVLLKADGMPTYHLANVADDYLMKISHVIRGEEWLPSLPLHVLLYEALGWSEAMPRFAHLPLLLKPGGQGKLSKRDGDKLGFPVFPLEWKDPSTGEISPGYREEGYFPEAFLNLLALLGWNPGTDKEIFPLDELIREFSLERVHHSGARFDPEKARWFNHQYLVATDDSILAAELKKTVVEKGYDAGSEKLERICSLVKERTSFVREIWEQASFFFERPGKYDEKLVKKAWKQSTPGLLGKIAGMIGTIEPFTAESLASEIKSYLEKEEIGMGSAMIPLRLALVGEGRGPDLFTIMELLGRQETIDRIRIAIERIGS